MIVKEDTLRMGILNEIPDLPLTLLFPANTAASLLALVLKPTLQEWKNTARSSGHLISEGAGQDYLAWKIPRAWTTHGSLPGVGSASLPPQPQRPVHILNEPHKMFILRRAHFTPTGVGKSESKVFEKIALIALMERHCQVTSKNKICWMDAV